MGARDCTRASAGLLRKGPARSHGFNGGARLYARKLEALGRRVPGANYASMGARDCTRASLVQNRNVARDVRASMGARDCTRASGIQLTDGAMTAGQLQWGRAIVRAQAREAPCPRDP